MNTALHRMSIVIDGHCDILMAISSGKSRLRNDMSPVGIGKKGSEIDELPAQYNLPQWSRGGITVQVCAIFLDDRQLVSPLRNSLEMVWWLNNEIHENPRLEMVLSVEDILRIKQNDKVGLLLALEGLEPIEREPWLLDIFYKLGLRMAGLSHSRRNYYADGSQWDVETGGLTMAGRSIISRMNDLGIVIDMAHLNQKGYWEVLELSKHPVIVSHSSPHKYYPDDPENDSAPRYPRQDTTNGRQRLDALAKNRGVFGVIFYRQKSLDAILDDIDFLLDRIGPEHVGLGSDYFGFLDAPQDFKTISQLSELTDGLLRRGLSDEIVEGILGKNYLRVFQEVWK